MQSVIEMLVWLFDITQEILQLCIGSVWYISLFTMPMYICNKVLQCIQQKKCGTWHAVFRRTSDLCCLYT